MMTLEYSSPCQEIKYDRSAELMRILWRKETENMTDGQFRKELEARLEFLEKAKTRKILMDCYEFSFNKPMSTQLWLMQDVYPLYEKLGVGSMAVLKSAVPGVACSLHQVASKNFSGILKIEFFDNLADAIRWLRVS
ncbi:MAG: hypothetical protein MI784_10765 [Cytophagales bacterium]|nr:hypothetical protein [Cytophagales bacterium]